MTRPVPPAAARTRSSEAVRAGLFAVALLALPSALRAEDAPAFRFDPARAFTYLSETLSPKPGKESAELRAELSALVDEILDGPWAPLYVDYSAKEAGGVGPAEWAFTRPGEQLLALAEAAPYLSGAQRKRAAARLAELVGKTPPTRKVTVDARAGKPRTIRKAPPAYFPPPKDPDAELFADAYAVWAWAAAFDAWDAARPAFEDFKALRPKLSASGAFEPAYRPGEEGVLTAAVAADPVYRFAVLESLVSGLQDNYGYFGAREAAARMVKGKPVFPHARHLSALIGYHRLAKRFGDTAEADWAEAEFRKAAAATLHLRSAAFLWSDPYLVPEVARLLRDNAGAWLDELDRLPPVGMLPAKDWDNRPIAGRKDQRVINRHTWFHAWGGQGEGLRPRTVMGAFLVHARLFAATPERVAGTLDVPWCKADLYHLRKLVVALQAAEGAAWTAVR
jgi:hypothetical protein